MSAPDLYAALEIPADADDAEIRRAYQRLARRDHPDLRPGDAAGARRFAAATRAFEVLSDPERRRRYDRLREEGGEGEVEDWVERWSHSEEVLASVDDDGRLRSSRRVEVRREVRAGASAPAGRRGGRRGASPAAGPPPSATEGAGQEAVIEVVVDLAEAVRGTSRSFPLQREIDCPQCDGDGRRRGEGCERCGGRGTLVELERVRVRLPRGVDDGDRLRVRGKGPPIGPGRQGDLLLVVRLRRHPYFRRQGLDVHADLPITLAEAVFGAEVDVPTIDGPVRVRIAAGTSGGRVLRLAGRGISAPGGAAGDHFARITLQLPRQIDDDLRQALRRQGREEPRRGLPNEGI